MQLKSPITFVTSFATAAGLLLIAQSVSGEEYGESFYRNNASGAIPPANLKTPAELGSTRQLQGVIVDSNLDTGRIAVRDGKNQIHWLNVPKNSSVRDLVQGGRVWVTMAGFQAIEIIAG